MRFAARAARIVHLEGNSDLQSWPNRQLGCLCWSKAFEVEKWHPLYHAQVDSSARWSSLTRSWEQDLIWIHQIINLFWTVSSLRVFEFLHFCGDRGKLVYNGYGNTWPKQCPTRLHLMNWHLLLGLQRCHQHMVRPSSWSVQRPTGQLRRLAQDLPGAWLLFAASFSVFGLLWHSNWPWRQQVHVWCPLLAVVQASQTFPKHHPSHLDDLFQTSTCTKKSLKYTAWTSLPLQATLGEGGNQKGVSWNTKFRMCTACQQSLRTLSWRCSSNFIIIEWIRSPPQKPALNAS